MCVMTHRFSAHSSRLRTEYLVFIKRFPQLNRPGLASDIVMTSITVRILFYDGFKVVYREFKILLRERVALFDS